MRAGIGLLATILLAVGGARDAALWEPPTIWVDVSVSEPAGTRDFVPQLKIGSLAVVLEKTPLLDVGRRFNASIGHRGDAGDSLSWVCFQGRDQQGPWVLWLESGEIHGETVGGFPLKRRGLGERVDNRCVGVGKTLISMPLPVRLGMTRRQLLRLVGRPTAQSEQILVFVDCHGVNVAGRLEPFDLCSDLRVQLKAGIIDAFEVWRTTTS